VFWLAFVQLHHLYPSVGLSSSGGISMMNDSLRFLLGGIHSFMLHSISVWENVRCPSPSGQLDSHKILVYSNSVLATLNARITIRGLGEDSDELSFSLQTATKSYRPTLNTSALMVRSHPFCRCPLIDTENSDPPIYRSRLMLLKRPPEIIVFQVLRWAGECFRCLERPRQ